MVYKRRSDKAPQSKFIVMTVLQLIAVGIIEVYHQIEENTNKVLLYTRLGVKRTDEGNTILIKYMSDECWDLIPTV